MHLLHQNYRSYQVFDIFYQQFLILQNFVKYIPLTQVERISFIVLHFSYIKIVDFEG